MITKAKSVSIKDLAKYFSFNLTPLRVKGFDSKQKLIEMANNKEKRPSQKTRIGRSLSYFTIKSSPSYDPAFDKIIRKLAPHWFFSQSQTANLTKQKLIEMAKNKEDRPHWKTKLAYALGNYTLKSSPAYDPDFDKIIRELAPHWFKK
jgi:hypothetical protein